MFVYPRLPPTVAQELAKDLAVKPIEYLREHSGVTHQHQEFAATGTRVNDNQLEELVNSIRDAATSHGYPDPSESSRNEVKRAVDTELSKLLHSNMYIDASEASRRGVWSFMACVMLPDMPRWRFWSEEGTTLDRYSSFTRNIFARLWWRSYILFDDRYENPYRLVEELHEDELVQLMERPVLAGNRMLTRATAECFLEFVDEYGIKKRMIFLRDAQKRIRRLFPLLTFDLLPEASIRNTVENAFSEAIDALSFAE